jgi:hypothetical protein
MMVIYSVIESNEIMFKKSLDKFIPGGEVKQKSTLPVAFVKL